MIYRTIEARRPWSDQGRKDEGHKNEAEDTYSKRYERAIVELHAALRDGKTHDRAEVSPIAKKYKVPLGALCDRSGVYIEGEEVIWINAETAVQGRDGKHQSMK